MGVLPTLIHQYTQDTRLLCFHLSGMSITVIILTFWQARLSASPVSRSSKHRFPQAPALVKTSLLSAVLNLIVGVHTGPHKVIVCSVGKESTCQCRRPGLEPWIEKIPGEGNGHPLQYSCLEHSMGRRVWWLHCLEWPELDTTWQLKRHHTSLVCSILSPSRQVHLRRY